eukprot:TRINITY_DN9935_c0_g1_i9.p1 TRINITY_DN9935_c0_g1~~TRINITY_DN9935_c0_g1_i9.p1  ORF type:complete len:319 (+),score=80.08 TRINITY_DN9935_c0_g1_i9:122-1078(+)
MEEIKGQAEVSVLANLVLPRTSESTSIFCHKLKNAIRKIDQNVMREKERKGAERAGRGTGEDAEEEKSREGLGKKGKEGEESKTIELAVDASFDPFEYESVFPTIGTLHTQPSNIPNLFPLTNLANNNVMGQEGREGLPVSGGVEAVRAAEKEQNKDNNENPDPKNLILSRKRNLGFEVERREEYNKDNSQIQEEDIYKSILKDIRSFLSRHPKETKKILKRKGYLTKDQGICMGRLERCFKYEEQGLGLRKRKMKLEKLVNNFSPEIYIVQKVLKKTLDDIDSDNLKFNSTNMDAYRKICQDLYEKSLYTVRDAANY